MGEVIKIPVDLMKEDLGRISQWIALINTLSPVALGNLGMKQFGESIGRVNGFVQNTGEVKASLDYTLVQGIGNSPRILFDAFNDALIKSQLPLNNDSEKKDFSEFISGIEKLSFNSEEFDCDVKNKALRIYSALFYTRDLFTIFSNLLPTLSRIEKLLTLQEILLAESAHCAGESHPVSSALRNLHAEDLVPWKGNEEVLSDGPAMEIFERLKPYLSAGHPAPLDFASFSQSCPSWDAFWQIAAWKSFRMEQALDATVRELLIEVWKCPEKAVSPTPPEPEEPVAEERRWDWATEKESVTPGIPRGGIRTFAYGKGHPVADALWDVVWDAEHERRSYTDEIPLTFPKDLHTFRCAIPVETKAVREILARPWRHAAEKDVPDFSNLWGGFVKEAERILTGATAESKEEKSFYEDLRKGMESTYKRGIGMLDHLAGVQEYYRPLRAIDPAEWRDKAEKLREESMTEMSGRE